MIVNFKKAKIKKLSPGEEGFALQLKAEGVKFEREFMFMEGRKFRFDFALEKKIAVEIEGGSWTKGAHTRGLHFESDCVKYSEALIRGWRVFRFPTRMVDDGRALKYVLTALYA